MKTKSNFERLLMTISFAIFIMFFISKSQAQEPSTAVFKAFKITIEMTEKGLSMQSHQGSAWIDLSFSLANYKPQAIDEYGMTELGMVSNNKDPELADYLFTITKTKDGISLTGIEGTAWKKLSFSLKNNKRQSIDQFGMTD